MKVDDLRSEFCIYIFLPESLLTSEFKQLFASSGYETYVFIDEQSMMIQLAKSVPHVILFSAEAIQTTVGQFFDKILTINSEIQFLCIGSNLDFKKYIPLKDFNLTHFISSGEELASRALWAIDATCEKLALTYQNENLLNQFEKKEKDLEIKSAELKDVKSKIEILSGRIDIKLTIENYAYCNSKEELINLFIKSICSRDKFSNSRIIFFKYLPTVMSFVATLGANIDLEKVRGIGTKITSEEVDGDQPNSLLDLLRKNFHAQSVESLSLRVNKQLEGIFLIWSDQEVNLSADIQEEFFIFQLAYQKFHFLKKLENLETTDSATELFNSTFYSKKIEEEVSRAKRLSLPVSIVKISVDNISQIEKQIGVFNRDLILKSIALLVKKTSRANDFACRTDQNEMTMIMPHASKKGAALRSERLRRTIESHSFALNGLHVTVSMGVSEYPSLCNSSQELDSSARHALSIISGKGGNKVCIYTPRENFKPEFKVTSIEG